MAFVFGLIVNELLEQNIPHNVMMTDGGNAIYIMPRKFQTEVNRSAWLEFCGIFQCKSVDEYSHTEAQYMQKIAELQY
jgi:hypothetical protein